MLTKIKSTIDKGVTSVSIKSNELIETAKLKTHNASLEKEIEGAKTRAGGEYYSQWKAQEYDLEKINVMCTNIKDNENLIKINVRKIDELQRQNESILNGMSSSSNVCKCGYANNPSAKFCVKCGEKTDEGYNLRTSGSEYRVCTCGYQSDKNAKFCIKCGQNFETLE